jgi:hypothetical protein
VIPPPEAVTVKERLPLLADAFAVTVTVDVPEPPGIEEGLAVTVIPVFMPLTDTETAELKLPDGVRVTVKLPELPRLTVIEPVEVLSVKFALEVTTTLAVALCTRLPLVPVTVTEYVPGAIVGAAVRLKVPEDEIAELVSPAGSADMVHVTDPVNPPMGVAVAV